MIDRVEVRQMGSLTVEKWKAMPLLERVDLMSRLAVRFYSGDAEIPAKEAVVQLR